MLMFNLLSLFFKVNRQILFFFSSAKNRRNSWRGKTGCEKFPSEELTRRTWCPCRE